MECICIYITLLDAKNSLTSKTLTIRYLITDNIQFSILEINFVQTLDNTNIFITDHTAREGDTIVIKRLR